jgi:subfamily B ATP-binding cassette protein MsbA
LNPLFRLLRFSRPYRGRLVAAFLGMVLYALGSAGLAKLIQNVFDEVLKNGQDLLFVACALITANVAKGVGGYFSAYLMSDVGQRVVMDVRNRLFRHMLNQSAAFFSRRSSGQLMSRITNDVGQIQQAVSETMGDLARESLALVGYLGLLFYYDATLALVVVTSAPLIVYPLVRLGRRLRRTSRHSQEALELLSHVSSEAFTGQRIVKAFAAESREADRFGRASDRLYRANMKVTAALSALPAIMEILGGLGMAAALWYGVGEIRRGSLTPGQFTSFFAALFLMYGPAKKLSRVNASLQQAGAASERIFEILDLHSEVVDRPGAAALPALSQEIAFHDVGFRYDDDRTGTILSGISLTIRAGQIVAIVGRNGAGKTTLVNLLPRFYDVTSGAITIDGIDIREVALRSLRSQIGIVTQETVLFDETIAANIAYGSESASQEAVCAAARAAHAHDFIAAMPDGYRTVIGERGQKLSGGQRQRLAIARALLKNSPILIMDEATSSLDAESEQLVQEALDNLMANRTAIVIAHRLSTVRRADLIVVLERGKIVETGRHEELLARPGGAYARLHAMQLAPETGSAARDDSRVTM